MSRPAQIELSAEPWRIGFRLARTSKRSWRFRLANLKFGEHDIVRSMRIYQHVCASRLSPIRVPNGRRKSWIPQNKNKSMLRQS